jgi:hypothetical protein
LGRVSVVRVIRLATHRVEVAAPRGLTFEVVASAGKTLEKRSDCERIVEFVTKAGDRKVRTLERLRLDFPRDIHYEWLEGPLPRVSESITFLETGPGATEMVYEGVFSMGRGLIRHAVGHLKVKPLFDRLALEHLLAGKEIAERRPERSHLYPKQARPEPSNMPLSIPEEPYKAIDEGT